MLKKIIFLSFLMLLAVKVTNAQESFHNRKDHPRQMPPKLVMDDLNLNEEQKAKFDKIVNTNQDLIIDIHYQIDKKRMEFRKELQSSQKSDVLLKIDKEINELRSKIDENRLKTWIEVKSILNEEQKKIWTEQLMFREGKERKPRR